MMYSKATAARTLWFVIWVRQLVLAQQLRAPAAHYSGPHLRGLSGESGSWSSSFKVGPLSQNVTSKTHPGTPEQLRESNKPPPVGSVLGVPRGLNRSQSSSTSCIHFIMFSSNNG